MITYYKDFHKKGLRRTSILARFILLFKKIEFTAFEFTSRYYPYYPNMHYIAKYKELLGVKYVINHYPTVPKHPMCRCIMRTIHE